jgi:hypothetical protein
MFSFCSYEVKPDPLADNLIFLGGPPGNIVARSGVWISGKKICGKTDGFGEPSRLNEASATIRR